MGEFTVKDLGNGIWTIDEGRVRSYLVCGDKEALLIDTGFGAADFKEEIAKITDLPFRVALTHADMDHLGGCDQFEEVYLHPCDYHMFRKHEEFYGVELIALRDGDVFHLGNRNIEVIHIPGHTPGSVAFLDQKAKVLFSGDTVQEGPIFMFGDNRSLEAFRESLARLSGRYEDFNAIYPAHHSFPISREYIPALIVSAKELMSGKLVGEEGGPSGMNAKVYRDGDVSFLYYPEISGRR